jgi:hypothetical protein
MVSDNSSICLDSTIPEPFLHSPVLFSEIVETSISLKRPGEPSFKYISGSQAKKLKAALS